MNVLLFCAKGFETMEFSVFVDVMGWAANDYRYPVEVVTCGFTKTVVSTFGVPVVVDCTIDAVSADDFDALAIPGGFAERKTCGLSGQRWDLSESKVFQK